MPMLTREQALKIFTRADRKDVYVNIRRLYLKLEKQVAIDDNVTDIDIKHLLTMLGWYLEKHNSETDVLGITIGKTVKCILKNVDCFLPENTPEQRNVTINILRSILYHARRYDRAMAKYKREQDRISQEKYAEKLKNKNRL